MNDETRQDIETERDDKAMARLLRLAGPRAPIPEDVQARVYARVQQEWRASSEQPDGARVYAAVHRQWQKRKPRPWPRRLLMPIALAATMIIAITVVLQPDPPVVPVDVPIGTIARVAGSDGGGTLPAVGAPVFAGETLATGAGQRISLVLGNAESLRIDEQTIVVVAAQDEFRLEQGRVYADTGDFMYRQSGLIIETPMGSVRDVGTQFSVSLSDDSIDVAVREGRVDVSRDAEQFVAVAGERLQIHREDGASVDALAAHDPYWDWTSSLAPAFDLEDQSLLDFLRWAARETGRELVFESNELRMSAMRTDLHGSVDDFDPLDAVESVLATTNFKYRLETGRIVIEE